MKPATEDIRDRIDPEVRARLDQLVELVGPGGLSGITDIGARRKKQAELAALVGSLRPAPDDPGDVEALDLSFPPTGSAAPAVTARLYRPRSSSRPAPCIYYIHGGGMVGGSVAGDEPKAVELARDTGCVVVSVEYRLAPEHPYPAAVHDCYAGLAGVAERCDELGVDAERIGLYGSSAGGGLVAAVALMARDEGGPAIAFQMLLSPMLDDRTSTPSATTNTGFGAWSREANIQAWQAVLGDAFGTDHVSPYAAPARATDLGGLPPTYVDVGDLDLFRDEAVDFATRLSRAGVPIELHVYPGGIHGGESLAPSAALNVRVRGYREDALRRALVSGQSPEDQTRA